jgi:hypothetical protein
VLVLTTLLASCGGGGGEPPTAPGPSITFSGSAAGANSISLQRGSGSGPTVLVVEVVATDVDGLYGVAFDLRYPADLLSFEGASEGDLLDEEGAVATTMQLAETAPGTLVIGLSRLGAVGGVSGSGVLLSLELRSRASGSGSFVFDANEALDTTGNTLAGVAWTAGSVQVRL